MQLASLCYFNVLLICVHSNQYGLVPEMYCGLDNCYDVLNVSPAASRGEIAKSYRRLAREFHPDYMQSHGASKKEIEEGVEKFHSIAVAYETLRDSKEEYDYYLQHPEEYYYNYYRYYKRKIPNVDVRIVVVGTITVISIFQYISWLNSYNTAISYMSQTAKYRTAAKDEAKQRGLWLDKNQQRKKNRSMTREEIKEEEENLIRQIIMEKMDIRGAYQKPSYTDVLWMQIILLPYYMARYFWFHIDWFYTYSIKKQDFNDEAKSYLICKHVGIKTTQWNMMSPKEKQVYFTQQLWVKSKATEYVKLKKEEARVKMADDPKMKRYRRWMNKGGAGRMTFMED